MQVKGGCAAKMHFVVDAYLEEMKPWTTFCLGLLWGCGVWAQTDQTLHQRWPTDIKEVTQCVSTSVEGGRVLLGTTRLAAADAASDLLEVNSAGHVTHAVTLRRPSGAGDLQLVHLEPEGSGYVACGHTLLNGQRRPVVMKFNGDLDLLVARAFPVSISTPQGTAVKEGVALHVTPDNAGGLIVSGFVGDSTLLQDMGAGARQALAMRLTGDLNVSWARLYDSPNPVGVEDHDAFNHALPMPNGQVFFSGSSNTQDCIQEASAVVLNGADGQLIWARQLARELTGQHRGFSGDAWFDPTSQRIHQIVNHSWDHTWAFTTWDTQGNVVLGQTWQSDYADDNWQGMTLIPSVAHPGRWVMAGQHRVGSWQDANGLALYGTTPFLTEFDANGVVYFSREYLVPQNNATILTPTDMLSSFVDNHGRFRSPTVALPMTSDSIPGYGLHGYRSEPGGVSNGVETVRTTAQGFSPCPSRPLYTSLHHEPIEVEQTLGVGSPVTVSSADVSLVVSLPEWNSAQCGSQVSSAECTDTPLPNFSVTAGTPADTCLLGCMALFDGLLPSGFDPNVHCLRLDFGDGTSLQFTGVPDLPLMHCYPEPLQWEGPEDVPLACLEVRCCETQTVVVQQCLPVDLPCFGVATDPFDPVDPDPVNACGIADGAMFALGVEVLGNTVSDNGVVCCEVAVCPEMPPGTTVDVEALCVRMDFGNGDVVDNLPFQQCQLRCLELGPTLITAEAYCCSDPDGFAMQAMALHTCVTQDVCPGDLDGDQAVGVSDLLGMLSLFGATCD